MTANTFRKVLALFIIITVIWSVYTTYVGIKIIRIESEIVKHKNILKNLD